MAASLLKILVDRIVNDQTDGYAVEADRVAHNSEAGTQVSQALDELFANRVSSAFARVGDVVATVGDYSASLIANDSTVTGASVKDALETLDAIVSAPLVTSVFGRVGAVTAQAGDYLGSQLTNLSGVAGATVSAALDNMLFTVDNLGSDDLTNLSQVAGGNVSQALDNLDPIGDVWVALTLDAGGTYASSTVNISFDVIQFGGAGLTVDLGAGTVTIIHPGVYWFACQLRSDNAGTGNPQAGTWNIQIDGSNVVRVQGSRQSADVGNSDDARGAGVRHCSAGDVVRIRSNTANSRTLSGTADNIRLSVVRLGP